MKNLVQDGAVVRMTAPYTVTSGSGAKIGSDIFGVAMLDITSGAVGDFATEGVFDITKAAGAWTEGAIVYWDNTNKVATLTQAGNMRIGVAVLLSTDTMPQSGDATGRVLLDQARPLRVAYGQMTTASASDTVVTGLTTVVSAVANMEDAPVIGAYGSNANIGDQAGTPAAGSILIKSYKPTATGDATPIAASTFGKKVNWMAIGT